jgi:hypothetical protein
MLIDKLLGFNVYRSPDDGAGAGGGQQKDPAGDAGGDKGGADAAAAAKATADAAAAAAGDKGGAGGDGKGGDGKGGADDKGAAPVWPTDWRVKGMVEAGLAADDKKTLGLLERYTSPGDVIKKMLEQEKLISSGALKKPITKDSTPEQVAQWRKENNVPETPDKYDTTLADGLVIGEADKPIVDNMLKVFHDKNVPSDVAKDMLSAYFAQEKQFLADRAAQMAKFTKEQDNSLHEAWGKEYTPNNNSIENLKNTFSEATRDALASALDSNMMPLMDNAAFKRDLAMIARALNPHDIVTDPSGSSQYASVEDEISSIVKLMPDKNSEYWKGPLVNGKDTKLQARYLELVSWTEAQKAKK